MATLDRLVRVTSALADPSRVRLLAACFGGERCVCQLVELLGRSNATVSKHLAILRDAGLLDSRKEGRWVYYRLPDEPGPEAADAIGLVRRHAAGDGVIGADCEQMGRILAVEPAVLCRSQRAGCCVVED
ncbi:MAG TPA: ArsR family transcriptional regulator, partial [Phycisphaerales bacterium]|nr:ArsR family transcriptional regulator [Phycisphaerales bacterium]